MHVGRIHTFDKPDATHARYLNRLRVSASLLALTLAGGLPNAARADQWTGAINTDWFTAGNWSTATVPNAATNIQIDTTTPNATVVDGGNATANLLTIGDTASGALFIKNGGTVSNDLSRIGSSAGATGSVFISNAGSTWTSSSNLTVGDLGNGSLSIGNGAKVSGAATYIGSGIGSTGLVGLDGAGSLLTSAGSLNVGYLGNGNLQVTNGATVSDVDGAVGNFAGSTGSVSVSGSGSAWINSADLFVGKFGDGALTVFGGGSVGSVNGYIGRVSGSTGTISISGTGTTWTNSGSLNVGYDGAGTLTIRDGGSVDVTGTMMIASGAGSAGTLDIGAASGQAPAGAGALNTALVSFGAGTGTINFNHTDPAYIFAPAIQGLGTVNQLAGNTILTADSSGFTGTTNVMGGRLSVDGTLGGATFVQNGGALGGKGTLTGDISVASGGTLLGVQGQTLTTGNLALASGANVNVSLGALGNVTGLFKVNGNLMLAGTLNVSDAGGFGQGVYRIFDYSGSLTDNGMNVGTIPTGNGTIQAVMANQVNLVVDSGGPVATVQFWNGTTTVADGTIHGGNGVWSAGPATNWTDTNGATAAAWGGNFAIFQNNPGNVTVDASAGTVATTGMQFIGTGWTVAGDPITLNGAGGDTTVRVGDGTLGGAAHRATIASELTGNSRLVKDDLGTLILTGANSYTGGTTIAAGTLQIGNGGTAGAMSGDVLNNGALAFNRSDDLTFAGVIGGSGSLRQTGSGKIDLTGNSGGFTGMTTVEAGTLAVNGQLGGALDVWAAGRLQGTGTVGHTTVSGTIAPGNSIGTINVGDITFNAGSIYEAEVNAAGQADRIAASGTATINGGSVKVLAGTGNYAPATQYTILTANGGRSGAFTGGVTSNLAFLDPSLSYDANTVYLTMTRNDIDFQSIGVTPNQIAAGGGVESLGFGNSVYNAVLNLSAPQARYAFDRLSGEVHTSAKTVMIEDSRFLRNAVNDRIRAAFGGVGASGGNTVTYDNGQPRPVDAATDGGAVWGQAFGSWGHWNSDGNAARLNRAIGGFFVGADAPAFDSWRFGAVAGYSRTSFNAKDRNSSGTSDNYSVGIYGGTTGGNLGFRTGAAYTVHGIATSRSVVFPGLGDSLKADYHAGTAQAFGELGYGMTMDSARFEPFANVAYVNLRTGRFTENGVAAALTSPSSNADATFTTLGLRAATSFDLNGTALTAKGMAGWRHAFGDVTPLSTMRFASGGNAFTIAGVPIARDAAVIETGLDFALSSTATLGVSYGGQFGSGATDQSVKANLNVKF